MTPLVMTEIRRFLARRLFRVIALLVLAGILVAGTVVFFRSSKTYTAPEMEVNVLQNGRQVECSGGNFGITGSPRRGQTPEEFCNDFASDFGGDPRFHLTSLNEAWLGLGAQLIIIAWLLGGSFAGAERHSGSMTTLLTWEPRRARVFMAKLIAVVVLVYLGAVVLEALLGLALLPAAAFRGTTTGADAAWFAESAGVLGRVGLACAAGGALGYGLAMVGRNTAASLGVGFGYLLIGESLVRGFKPQWGPWLLGDNTAAFVGGGEESVIAGRSTIEAGLVMGLYACIALLAGWSSFRRRDVT